MKSSPGAAQRAIGAGIALALSGRAFAFVGSAFALVGSALPPAGRGFAALVGCAFALTGRGFAALVGCAFALTGCGFALTGCGFALAGCGFALPASSVPAPDAIDWHAEPVQGATWRTPFAWPTPHGEVQVRPRAAFDISAVVAAAEPYSFDDSAFLSPVDLVMTWGLLPEEPYRSRVSYYQITRYYFWRTRDPGLDLSYIATHSANMHMIPSTRNLARALAHVGRGERVRVRGLLVDVESARGFRWQTSLSRDDTGPGACELVWVEELQRGRRLYR